MASSDTTGSARDIIGPLTDIARAMKAQHQAFESGRLQGPTGATGATGPMGPTGATGATGSTAQFYASSAWHTPLLVEPSRGMEFVWDAGTSKVTIQTNFDLADWLATDAAYHYPLHFSYGRGLEFIWDAGLNKLTLETNFPVPSSELYWSDWGSRVSFGSADTVINIHTLDMTDPDRASQTWAIQVEFEALIIRQSDPTQRTNIRNSELVSAQYDGSGVPTMVTTFEASSGALLKWAGGGIPVINDFYASVSTNYLIFTLTKSVGGVDCYAKCRVRKCTEMRVDNW